MSDDNNPFLKTTGRGAIDNATGRFEHTQLTPDFSSFEWFDEEDKHLLKTQFFKDISRTIVNENESPDIPFRYSINPYRGCEHGCVYCYARPTHEYLGYSAGLDFESKIFVKHDAATLLRKKLMSPRWEPDSITMSGVTDCYQPAEKVFRITRGCLEVLAEFRNPVALITKNHLITRDVDVLSDLAQNDCVLVLISVTTLNTDLGRTMEPRTSSPQARLKAIETLRSAGVPVCVNVAPIVPGLTDHEIPAILKAVSEAGALSANYVPLRLPYSVSTIFTEWLEKNYPEKKEKVLNAIRSIRGGKLNDPNFGSRMEGSGVRMDQIAQTFDIFSRKYGLDKGGSVKLTTKNFQRPGDQLNFDL